MAWQRWKCQTLNIFELWKTHHCDGQINFEWASFYSYIGYILTFPMVQSTRAWGVSSGRGRKDEATKNWQMSGGYDGIVWENAGKYHGNMECIYIYISPKVQGTQKARSLPRGPEKELSPSNPEQFRGSTSRGSNNTPYWLILWRNAAVKKYTTYYPQNIPKLQIMLLSICSRLLSVCSRLLSLFYSIRGSFWGPRVTFWDPRVTFEGPT